MLVPHLDKPTNLTVLIYSFYPSYIFSNFLSANRTYSSQTKLEAVYSGKKEMERKKIYLESQKILIDWKIKALNIPKREENKAMILSSKRREEDRSYWKDITKIYLDNERKSGTYSKKMTQ